MCMLTISRCFFYVHADHIKMIKNLFNNYNIPQYEITVDESPYSFCAEPISVRMIDNEKMNVIEILAGLNMYEQSPNGKEATASLLHL